VEQVRVPHQQVQRAEPVPQGLKRAVLI